MIYFDYELKYEYTNLVTKHRFVYSYKFVIIFGI
jgi:hypothetical protein